MKQLELKHIAPYLPYNLKCKYPYGNKEGLVRNVFNLSLDSDDVKISVDFMDGEHVWMFIPLLRPMSDLFENIVHNEEIVCVAKVIKNLDYSIEWWNESRTALHYPETGEFCITSSDYELDYKSLDYSIIETLFKYHFDVFGLIEKGLAEPIVNEKTKA